MKKEFSCGIVPLREGEGGIEVLLIIHCKGSYWAFPKGHQDLGETLMQTAERELQEETGLVVEQYLSYTPYEETYTFYRNRAKVFKKVIYFPALVKGTLCLQEEEILDAKWFPIEEAKNQVTFPKAKEICTAVAAFF